MSKTVPAKSTKLVKVTSDNVVEISGTAAAMAFGSDNEMFFSGLVDQLLRLTAKEGKLDQSAVDYITSIIAGVKPRDEVEAMLAAQMAATHNLVITFARQLTVSNTIPQQDSADRAYNKLARTFAAQVEALKRYRSKGEQKVVVEHVTVNEGGQAIVGAVNTGGRGSQ